MKKSVLSIVLAMAFVLTMIAPVISVPVSAASAVQFTLSNVSGKLGDTVEVKIDVSANS